jgi:hypothetical protein
LKIKILNWEKYNPKRAQNSYSWLRLNNDFFTDQKIFMFSLEQKAILIFLLSFASKENKAYFEIEPLYAAKILGIEVKKFLEALKIFKEKQIVEYSLHDTTPDYTKLHQTTPTRRDETRRDETDETGAKNCNIAKRNKKEVSTGSMVWFAYAKAYAHKYKTEPVRNSKTNSICKRLVALVGLEKACLLSEHYLTINDQWYLKKGHSIELLINDYQKILTSYETGINITNGKARDIELRQENSDAISEGFAMYNKLKKEGKL